MENKFNELKMYQSMLVDVKEYYDCKNRLNELENKLRLYANMFDINKNINNYKSSKVLTRLNRK